MVFSVVIKVVYQREEMACSAKETSERVVRQVGRGARTSVERRDAGALVLWFVAAAVVDDVSAVAAVSVGVVTNEIRGASTIGGGWSGGVLCGFGAWGGGGRRHLR